MSIPSKFKKYFQVRNTNDNVEGDDYDKDVVVEANNNGNVKLTPLQQDFVRYALDNPTRNMCLLGMAGTGKSQVIHMLKTKLPTLCCTPTGVSASNIDGSTIHKAFGIGYMDKCSDELVKTFFKSTIFEAQKASKFATLIIDEISMVSKQLFALVASMSCNSEKEEGIFTRLRVIVVGDFYQLPPVIKNSMFYETRYEFDKQINGLVNGYCFGTCYYDNNNQIQVEDQLWLDCNFEYFYFDEIIRQKDDGFCKILKEARFGQLSNESIDTLKKYERDVIPDNTVILAGKRQTVKDINKKFYDRLNSKEYTFKTNFVWSGNRVHEVDKQKRDKWENDFLDDLSMDRDLKLKVGSMVMCRVNIADWNIWNGTCGIIREIDAEKNKLLFEDLKTGNQQHFGLQSPYNTPWFPARRIDFNKHKLITVHRFPFCYGWSMTIHKSQSLTLDRAHIFFTKSEIFSPFQAYTALSRLKSLDGLTCSKPFDAKTFTVNDKAMMFDYFVRCRARQRDLLTYQEQEVENNDTIAVNVSRIIDLNNSLENDLPPTYESVAQDSSTSSASSIFSSTPSTSSSDLSATPSTSSTTQKRTRDELNNEDDTENNKRKCI